MPLAKWCYIIKMSVSIAAYRGSYWKWRRPFDGKDNTIP